MQRARGQGIHVAIAAGPSHDRGALLLMALAAAGVAISAYLTIAHYAGAALVCTQTAGIDCDAVTTSSYSLVPGTPIPISLVGLGWFVVSGALSALGTRPWTRPALLVWSAAGVAVVLYLVNVELTIVHAICEWCTALHVLIVATFFLALGRMREV